MITGNKWQVTWLIKIKLCACIRLKLRECALACLSFWHDFYPHAGTKEEMKTPGARFRALCATLQLGVL